MAARTRRRQATASDGSSPPSPSGAVPSQAPSPSPNGDAFTFAPATKHQAKLRLTLDGPSGSGKTYSALAIASALGKRIALIDTEHGSASKYAGDPFVFDTLALESFEPRTYVRAIHAAEAAGYDVLVVDSLSHAWAGKGGALEQVDQRTDAKGNKFAAWRHVTPMQNELIDTILGAQLHVIATMRTKTEYAVDQENGKTTVRKLGLAPVQREGVEYEFDLVGDLDLNHNLHITKTRCRVLDDAIIAKPGEQLARTLKEWLTSGQPLPPPSPVISLTHEQKSILTHLGNSLEPKWLSDRYGRELKRLGGFLPVRDLLLGAHREEHGVDCQHLPEAVLASSGTEG